VLFAGRREDVADHLRAGDLFAFPSAFEALGLSLVEAAACGLPAIGARTGGIVDVIEDGRSGRLVEPGDAGGLGRVLAELAGDAGLRERLGREARRVAERDFDRDVSLQRYRALFSGLSR
jgi:glycosyltransferase involved in cell wall biosynthesis